MSGQGEFSSYTREEFIDEFVHPDDRAAVQEARDQRALKVRADYLTEMRKKAGLTQAEVADAMGRIDLQTTSAVRRAGAGQLAPRPSQVPLRNRQADRVSRFA